MNKSRVEALRRRMGKINDAVALIENLRGCRTLMDFNGLGPVLRERIMQEGCAKLIADTEAELEVLLDPFEESMESVAEIAQNMEPQCK